MPECEAAYISLSEKIFGKARRRSPPYDAQIMENEMKMIVQDKLGDANAGLRDERENICKTFVVTRRSPQFDSGLVLLRSYAIEGNEVNCSIIQAARATSAAPTVFVPETIDDLDYIDGGIGFNNPSIEAMREAKRIWPYREIGCLISLGTGFRISHSPTTSQLLGVVFGTMLTKIAPHSSDKLRVAAYCTELAVDSQNVHNNIVEGQLLPKGPIKERYYRFNVSSGLADVALHEWRKLSEIRRVTRVYLGDPEVKERIREAVRLLQSDEELIRNTPSISSL